MVDIYVQGAVDLIADSTMPISCVKSWDTTLVPDIYEALKPYPDIHLFDARELTEKQITTITRYLQKSLAQGERLVVLVPNDDVQILLDKIFMDNPEFLNKRCWYVL